MEKFIYVFSDEDRDRLMKLGFKMIQGNKDKQLYIFMNDPSMHFALNECSFVASNSLTL